LSCIDVAGRPLTYCWLVSGTAGPFISKRSAQ
jgi:hypothetical protein